jgi:hypothetical protein
VVVLSGFVALLLVAQILRSACPSGLGSDDHQH